MIRLFKPDQFLIKIRKHQVLLRCLSSVKMSNEKTFEQDNNLPQLKVPDLRNTIQKYLDSVKAIATDEEFETTSQACQLFLRNEGPLLQQRLKDREQNHKNWVEELWLKYAYLQTRSSLLCSNFSGVTSLNEDFWPPTEGTQVKRCAFSLHLQGKFWKSLREEKVKPHKSSKGKYFSMDQYMSCYNSARVPQVQEDKVVSYFKLLKSGECPRHSIVICGGFIFKLDLLDGQGYVHSAPQIEEALLAIMKSCENKSSTKVAAMTSLDRDSWARARQHLIEMDVRNEENVKDIESAIHAVCIDDARTYNMSETMRNAMGGDSANRWRDKSYNEVWTRNGCYAAHCDHTAIDGMVFVLYIEYMISELKKCDGKWKNYEAQNLSNSSCAFTPLEFAIDDVITSAIDKGMVVSQEFKDKIQVEITSAEGVGKPELRSLRVHPDGFVQTCIQLAFMKLNGKPAPTYETSTTRGFYHGRTETCRTCTPELVAFCKAFIEQQHDDDSLYKLLMEAQTKYAWLMRECENNRGCDRHLFGLQLAAAKEDMDTPSIFRDKMYENTGGNGNFTLSTSFVGFTQSNGAVAPMTSDGFGIFYRMNNSRIVYSLLSWKDSGAKHEEFSALLRESFPQVFRLFQHGSKLRSNM